jgi:hypothetical protein
VLATTASKASNEACEDLDGSKGFMAALSSEEFLGAS